MGFWTKLFLGLLGSHEAQSLVPPCPIKKREKDLAALDLHRREMETKLLVEPLELEMYGKILSEKERALLRKK